MWEFQLGSIGGLERLGGRLGVRLEAIEDVSILAEPIQAPPPAPIASYEARYGGGGKGLVIPNSLAVHPMEGCDGDSQGRPSKLTLSRYERFAAGGGARVDR